MELRELAADVYACVQEDRGLGWSNSGLVNRGGGLVIDTFFDLSLTRRLIDTYATVAPSPARRLLNTHHNGDHCWGNQLFSGAEIIGHRLCAERMGTDSSPEMLQAVKDQLEGGDGGLPPHLSALAGALAEFDFAGIEVVPPTTLIDDRLDLDLDGTRVELIYVGPAHTAGDVVAHLPDDGVLFTGDILFRNCTPIGWEGSFATWMAALGGLAALEPEVVVPGHGPLCAVGALVEMRDYLDHVRTESAIHHRAGRSVVEACKRIDLGPYGRWNEPWRLPFNVHRAYRELDGAAWDEPIDALAIYRDVFEFREHWNRGHDIT